MSEDMADHQICCIFGDGEACARRGGYRSDNPHPYGSDLWAVWLEGFEWEEGPQFVAALNQKGVEG